MPKQVPRAGASKMKSEHFDFLKYYKELDGSFKDQIINSMPVMNPEGRILSDANIVFLAWQSKIQFTIVAGFRQWLKHGRCVKKGQHGNCIFIPAMNKERNRNADGSETVSEELQRFLVATVFDISQTFEITEKEEKSIESVSAVMETNPIYSQNGDDFDDEEEDEYERFDGWFTELETDACGNCYSDADPGL
ncbi:MAG: ArdC-like ssDNA-binding domain-containing protein [Bacteroidales bacterium]